MNNTKIKIIIKSFVVLICSAITLVCLSVCASADMGPKSSAHIKFENMGDELCYGTLLSSEKVTERYSAWRGTDYSQYEGTKGFEIWRAFVEYEDPDGFYFLQESWRIDEDKELIWDIIPPEKFKILLYYPETDTFISSGICETYAFDSYFTVDMEGIDVSSVNLDDEISNELLKARKSYNYWLEILAFIIRVGITLFIEIAVAKLFDYHHKRQLKLITIANLATQGALNLFLGIIGYLGGFLMFFLGYFACELGVLIAECAIYSHYNLDTLFDYVEDKESAVEMVDESDTETDNEYEYDYELEEDWEDNSAQQTRSRSTSFAIAANIVSFIVGCHISAFLLTWL